MSRGRRWRLAILGGALLAVLVGIVLLAPARRDARNSRSDDASGATQDRDAGDRPRPLAPQGDPAIVPSGAGESVPDREPADRSIDPRTDRIAPGVLAITIRTDGGAPVAGVRLDILLTLDFQSASGTTRSNAQRTGFARQHLSRIDTDSTLHAETVASIAACDVPTELFERFLAAAFPSASERRIAEIQFDVSEPVLAEASTDRDGTAVVELPEGTYRIALKSAHRVRFGATGDLGSSEGSANAASRPGATSREIPLARGERRLVEGVVGSRSIRGRLALPGPVVHVVEVKLARITRGDPGRALAWSIDPEDRASTSDGEFRFDGVRIGSFTIRAVAEVANDVFVLYEHPFEVARDEADDVDLGPIAPRAGSELRCRVVVERNGVEVEPTAVFVPPAGEPTPYDPRVALQVDFPISRSSAPAGFQYFVPAPLVRPCRIVGVPEASPGSPLGVRLFEGFSPLAKWELRDGVLVRWPGRQDVVALAEETRIVIDAIAASSVSMRVAAGVASVQVPIRLRLCAAGDTRVFGVDGAVTPERAFEALLPLPPGKYEYVVTGFGGYGPTSGSANFVATGSFEVAESALVVPVELGVGAILDLDAFDVSGAPFVGVLDLVPAGWAGSRGASVFQASADSKGHLHFEGLPPHARLIDNSGRGFGGFTTGEPGASAAFERRSQR